MNQNTAHTNNLYTISAGNNFADALCTQILSETQEAPEMLAKYLILLPTRRACRLLQNTFLQQTKGKPLLLPKLQSIGDIDEEELSLSLHGADSLQNIIDLPQAMPAIKRQFLLARTVQAALNSQNDEKISFSHAMALAKPLGHFMDQIHTEGLSLKDLQTLVPEEFATHWQITLDFLKILSEHWPTILSENNAIDYAQRRNILIETLAKSWKESPPLTPVIIAGTTGSIPAVTKLIQASLTLPHGRVILPGFDRNIDEKDWNSIDETHPQYGFKQLLSTIEQNRQTIQEWPQPEIPHSAERRTLSRELMRPSDTTENWTYISQNSNKQLELNNSLKNIQYYECENQQQEADLISLIMRELVETPHKTAALITPDRNLARRVRIGCQRWGIELDDSAGLELSLCATGIFMRCALMALQKNLSPVAFLSLLKQQIQSDAADNNSFSTLISALETRYLHGLKPPSGLDGLEQHIKNKEEQATRKDEEKQIHATDLVNQLQPIINKYYNNINNNKNLKNHIIEHINFCENFLNIAQNSHSSLWSKEEGEAASKLIAQLLEHAALVPNISIEDYNETFKYLLKTISVRPDQSTHPRLTILGQLEARLIDCDLLIMAGLNEGLWPSDVGHDPWMSRPMRKEFGLPSPERSIGLAAHDFIQGLCHKEVIITRSKTNNGSPTVPARWLQRLDTILQTLGHRLETLSSGPYLDWLAQQKAPRTYTPVERPAPTPPLATRPHKLSVTRIETWLKDPYSIYASHILKLKKLKPLEQKISGAERGTILHNTLDHFIKTHTGDINSININDLANISQNEIAQLSIAPEALEYWKPRLHRAFHWYIEQEQNWRTETTSIHSEIEGAYTLQTNNAEFTITARADRIDHRSDGTYALIDYKSAGQYAKISMENGKLPQLPLEAMILNNQGFTELKTGETSHLSYWVMTGGAKAGHAVIYEENIQELIEKTEKNIKKLITVFNKSDTPYYSIPDLNNAPAYNDYEHLARLQEWSTQDQKTTEAA